MTTSGTTTFSLTGDQIVNAAMRKLSVLGDGQSPTSTQLTNGTQALNSMLKTFTVKGMPLWATSERTLTMTATSSFTYGIGQTYNFPAPLKILSARLEQTSGGAIIPLDIVPRDEFERFNTASTGRPVSLWYEPLNQTGIIHIWPIPDSDTISNYTLKFVFQRPFEDQVSGSDTLDFPQWWHEAVIYGLAWRLCPDFGIPIQDRAVFTKEAEYFLEEALSFGTEEGSYYFQPDWAGR